MVNWSSMDVVSLLAWLDFCIENRLEFYETVIEHLRDSREVSTGEGFLFTKLQISNKLTDLARTKNPATRPLCKARDDLMGKGSSTLANLSTTIKQEIRTTLREYRLSVPESAHLRPYEEVKISRSKNLVQIPDIGSFAGDGQVIDPRSTSGILQNSVVRTARKSEVGLLECSTEWQRVKQHPSPTFGTEQPEAIHNSPSPNPGKLNIDTTSSHQGERVDICYSMVSCQDIPREHIPSVDHPHRQTLQRKDLEIKALELRWQQDLATSLMRENKLKQDIHKLRAENQHMLNAQQDRERAGKDPLEKDLCQQNMRIYNLSQGNEALRDLAPFFRQIPEETPNLHSTKIGDVADDLSSELTLLLHGHEISSDGLLMPHLSSETDLAALVRSALADRFASQEDKLLKDYVARFHPELVLKTLVLVAVREWVFKTDYPNLDQTYSALLESYREIVFNFGGWKGLKCCEVAAYNRAMEKLQFNTEIQSRKASLLAARLLRALAPLFLSDSDGDQCNFEHWSNEEEINENQRGCLSRLFEIALQFKADSVGEGWVFDFVIFPDGVAPGQSKTMSEQRCYNGGPISLHSNWEENFWAVASIHIYESKKAACPLDPFSDALIQANNFIGENDRVGKYQRLHSTILKIPKADNIVESLLSRRDNEVSTSREKTRDLEQDESAPPNVIMETIDSTTSADDNSRNQTEESQAAIYTGSNVHSKINFNERRVTCHSGLAQASKISVGRDGKVPDRDHRILLHGLVKGIATSGGPPSEAKIKAQKVTESIDFSCELCLDCFASREGLLRHQKNKACSRCLQCDVKFFRGWQLREHQKSGHSTLPNTEVRCDLCEIEFDVPWQLTKHRKRKHKTSESNTSSSLKHPHSGNDNERLHKKRQASRSLSEISEENVVESPSLERADQTSNATHIARIFAALAKYRAGDPKVVSQSQNAKKENQSSDEETGKSSLDDHGGKDSKESSAHSARKSGSGLPQLGNFSVVIPPPMEKESQ